MSRRPVSPYRPGRVIQPDDDPRMVAAIIWLCRNRIRFVRVTAHQLKIADLSFYPVKGTIYRDGDAGALPQRGLPSLQDLLRSRGCDQPDVGHGGTDAPPVAERTLQSSLQL